VSAGGGCLDPGQVDPKVDPEIHLEASQGSSSSLCSTNEKSHRAVASGLRGFPKFGAVAIEVPGPRHQHRLRAQKEPTISMSCRFQRIFSVPFACRFEALNHPLLPPLVVSSITGLLVPDQRRKLYMLCYALSIAQHVAFDFFRRPSRPPQNGINDADGGGRDAHKCRNQGNASGCFRRTAKRHKLLHVVMNSVNRSICGKSAAGDLMREASSCGSASAGGQIGRRTQSFSASSSHEPRTKDTTLKEPSSDQRMLKTLLPRHTSRP
jgi:hypothetical protein